MDQGGEQQFKNVSSVCKLQQEVKRYLEIESHDGAMVYSSKDKAEEGAHHYSNLFQEPPDPRDSKDYFQFWANNFERDEPLPKRRSLGGKSS